MSRLSFSMSKSGLDGYNLLIWVFDKQQLMFNLAFICQRWGLHKIKCSASWWQKSSFFGAHTSSSPKICTANMERDGFLYLRYLPCPFHKNVKLAGFIISWVSSYHNILVSSVFHHFLDSVWSSVGLSQILFIAWFVIFQKQAKLPLSYSLTGIWFVERSWLLAP